MAQHLRNARILASLTLTACVLTTLPGCDQGEPHEASSHEAEHGAASQPEALGKADAAGDAADKLPATGQGPIAGPNAPKKTSYDPELDLTGLYTYDRLAIPSHDGITLEAIVTEPSKDGKHPLIIMPASWANDRGQYEIPARRWAARGFVVISYTSRGFYGSQGEIDISGPDTVKDISSMIDWALANTQADPARIGALGISYGGGGALLAAAQDSRIQAVVSMSGWSDLRFSNYPHQTPSSSSGDLLVKSAGAFGRPGKVMKEVDDLLKDGKVEEALQIMDRRSPIKAVDSLNTNAPAIMIAHAWNDAMFPPSQMLRFFDALSTEKRIVLQPGDHATADGAGLAGLPNSTWDLGMRWMRKHVGGEDIRVGDPVVVVSNDNKIVRTAKTLQDWQPQKTRLSLGPPKGEGILEHFGDITPHDVYAWSYDFEGGVDTVADSGEVMLSGMKMSALGFSQVISTLDVDRKHAAVWRGKNPGTKFNVSGSPTVHLSVESSEPSVTLVAYLYESTLGVCSLMTYSPITLHDLKPGEERAVSVDLEPTQWHLLPGSEIVLVVDTMDDRFTSATQKGQSIKIRSSTNHKAALELPLN